MPLRDMESEPVAPAPAKQIPNVVKFTPPGPGGEDIGADPLAQSSAAPFPRFATTPQVEGAGDEEDHWAAAPLVSTRHGERQVFGPA